MEDMPQGIACDADFEDMPQGIACDADLEDMPALPACPVRFAGVSGSLRRRVRPT
jgi:hypothetical protein